ncbi:MAG: hypothetical protein WCO52_06525, partial [bacterium]
YNAAVARQKKQDEDYANSMKRWEAEALSASAANAALVNAQKIGPQAKEVGKAGELGYAIGTGATPVGYGSFLGNKGMSAGTRRLDEYLYGAAPGGAIQDMRDLQQNYGGLLKLVQNWLPQGSTLNESGMAASGTYASAPASGSGGPVEPTKDPKKKGLPPDQGGYPAIDGYMWDDDTGRWISPALWSKKNGPSNRGLPGEGRVGGQYKWDPEIGDYIDQAQWQAKYGENSPYKSKIPYNEYSGTLPAVTTTTPANITAPIDVPFTGGEPSTPGGYSNLNNLWNPVVTPPALQPNGHTERPNPIVLPEQQVKQPIGDTTNGQYQQLVDLMNMNGGGTGQVWSDEVNDYVSPQEAVRLYTEYGPGQGKDYASLLNMIQSA